MLYGGALVGLSGGSSLVELSYGLSGEAYDISLMFSLVSEIFSMKIQLTT